jgi:outer membrane protein OmpA-like peptidoglycan-associated protein
VKISAAILTVLVGMAAATLAQAQSTVVVHESNNTIVYRVNVVSRTTPALNYGHGGGSTKVNFQGTDLMPSARGVATVQYKHGATKISSEFEGFDRPTSFGNEYLTYVLWAITPEGRPVNLGEVLVGENRHSKLDVTTDLQAFALIVTAEPYYAVRRPSNVVVAENEIRRDTVGTSEAVNAKYELIDRGGYIPTGYQFDAVVLNERLPLEFFEARNALRIAKSEGAETFATTSYEKAVQDMRAADEMADMGHVDKKALIAESREVVQTADDAREIAVKRIDADRLAAERDSAAAEVADATAKSDADERARRQAEATADADRQRAEADRNAAEARDRQRDAQAESDRDRAAAANANQAAADAQQGRRDAEAESDRDRADAANSNQQLQQAVQDREVLRARLLEQFNAILTTHDTARGLVVNLSDVLFDTGKFTLRPEAREKLAKISGIILAYPDLRLAIEGNTDSVGSDAMNQELSEQRAGAVRDYLGKQSIPLSSMTAQGFGKTQPVASNDTPEGRQQNRHVEMVVSGDVIGTAVGPVSQNLPGTNRP